MNKTVVGCVVIIAAAAVSCFFIYSQNTRYIMLSAGDGQVYKTDQRTGQSVLLLGTIEQEVKPAFLTKQKSLEESAIWLAKNGYTLGLYPTDNESGIRNAIKKIIGPLNIIGWQAQQVDEQTFVVTYSYEKGEEVRSWAFEVKPKERLVRNIIGDSALENMYGFESKPDANDR